MKYEYCRRCGIHAPIGHLTRDGYCEHCKHIIDREKQQRSKPEYRVKLRAFGLVDETIRILPALYPRYEVPFIESIPMLKPAYDFADAAVDIKRLVFEYKGRRQGPYYILEADMDACTSTEREEKAKKYDTIKELLK